MKKISNFLKKIEFKYFLLPISIFLLILSIVLNGEQLFYISDETLVITFIGIIATFIVISNFSQVSEIKTDFNQKIIDQNKVFSDKINEIDKIFDEMNLIKEEIDKKNWYNLGETYRIFGLITQDNVRTSTFHFIDSIINYLCFYNFMQSDINDNGVLSSIFDIINSNLKENNWECKEDDINTFDSIIKDLSEIQSYDKRISELINNIELKRGEVQANLIKKEK